MRVSDYTHAAEALIHEGKPIEIVLKNLHRTLERRGARKLYVPVLRALTKRLAQRNVDSLPRVTLARPQDHERCKASIADSLREMELDEHQTYDIAIDDTLVGGYVLEAQSRIIDKSFKKQLLALYRSLKG